MTAGQKVELRVRARNVGTRSGRELAQVYLSRKESIVDRPQLWLAGFAHLEAAAGEEVTTVVKVAPRAFAHWAEGWQTEPGEYLLRVGRSVADLPLSVTVTVEH